jgi:sugar phosphate isomerase/epimerase
VTGKERLMRLGCAAYSYRDFLKEGGGMTLESFVDECARMGLDGVELTSYYFPSPVTPTRLHELKRHCFRRGMHILGTAVGSNFAQADEAARRAQVRMTCEWIDHSVTLGAPVIRVFAGPVPEGATEVHAFDWAVTCMEEVIDYGGQRGVAVALENHGGITGTADQVLRLVEPLKGPWFGLNLDFGNFRADPYAEIERCAPHAITTHVKRTTRGPSGPEPVDYARVADIMRRVGYTGYFSIEYEDRDDPRTAVPEFVQYLQQATR